MQFYIPTLMNRFHTKRNHGADAGFENNSLITAKTRCCTQRWVSLVL